MSKNEEGGAGDDENGEKKRVPLFSTLKFDLYDVLGLGEKRWKCSKEEIKRGHKKMCFKYHPDRNPDLKDDSVFKNVQAAYEILSDEKKRRLYDSKEKFVCKVPKKITKDNFFLQFGPLFEKWKKYSREKMPSLGDISTPWETVEQFYTDWRTKFRSWRDFSYKYLDENEEINSRFDRRAVEREMKFDVKKDKKNERRKLDKLITQAKKFDPRVKKHFKELKRKAAEEKKRKREEKELREKEYSIKMEAVIEKQELEERKRVEEEERKRIEENRKRDEEKKLFKQLESQLREMCESLVVFKKEEVTLETVIAVDLEYFILQLKLKELKKSVKKISKFEGDKKKICKALKQTVKVLKKKEEKRKRELEEKEREMKKKKEEEEIMTEWTREELKILRKAMLDIPSGNPRRFELISKCYDKFKVQRSPKEVKIKLIEIKKGGLKPPSRSNEEYFKNSQSDIKKFKRAAWSTEQQLAFEKALRENKKVLRDPSLWQVIADQVEGKNREECIAHFKKCREMALKKRAQMKK